MNILEKMYSKILKEKMYLFLAEQEATVNSHYPEDVSSAIVQALIKYFGNISLMHNTIHEMEARIMQDKFKVTK